MTSAPKFIRPNAGVGASNKADDAKQPGFTNNAREPTPSQEHLNNVCPHCGSCNLFLSSHSGECSVCGYTQVRRIVTKGAMAYNERIGLVAGNYRRFIHFRDILRKRMPTAAPAPTAAYALTLRNVALRLISKGVTSSLDVNMRNVARCAKECGVKQHNLILHLTQDLSGVGAPKLSPFDYQRLYCMFQAMQGPFERHKSPSRTNFLHYNHIAFRMFHLLGRDDWLYTYFWPMLGASKVSEFDDLFGRMCRDPALSWEQHKTYRLDESRAAQMLSKK